MTEKNKTKKQDEKPQQRTCATMEHHRHLVRSDEIYCRNRREIEAFTATTRIVARSTVLRIPVVVHVLYYNDQENISDEQIHSQIDVLKHDFRKRNADLSKVPAAFREYVADVLVEFELAVRDPVGRPTTGITRNETPLNAFTGEIWELDRKIKYKGTGHAAWPARDYLNIWVCNLGGSLLGYAQFPGGAAATDGVVIANHAFGTTGTATAPFNLGRTTTHEVGHWLNLLHIWGDDFGACSGSDNVGDTPNQAGSNGGKPEYPHISCNNGPHGDMFMNFMDYVDDDSMQMFTKGQVARMNVTLSGPRSSLAGSKGLLPPETEPLSLVDGNVRKMIEANQTESGDDLRVIFDGVSWVEPLG